MIINRLPSGRIQLWGHAIAVDWAEPEVEVDEDTMATVKILYVRNLMLQTTEETIEKEFNSLRPGTHSAQRSSQPHPVQPGGSNWALCVFCFRHRWTSEEDQRLCLCAFHTTGARHQCHEHPQRKGGLSSLRWATLLAPGCYTFPLTNTSSCATCIQVVDGSPIEVTLAKPVDKDSYVRYTRGTGGRGGSLLQSDYPAYTLGQVRLPASNTSPKGQQEKCRALTVATADGSGADLTWPLNRRTASMVRTQRWHK